MKQWQILIYNTVVFEKIKAGTVPGTLCKRGQNKIEKVDLAIIFRQDIIFLSLKNLKIVQ